MIIHSPECYKLKRLTAPSAGVEVRRTWKAHALRGERCVRLYSNLENQQSVSTKAKFMPSYDQQFQSWMPMFPRSHCS